MADNLDITEGTGTTIKTDDVGGIHYQQVKLVDGTLDSTTVIAVDVGAKANALRVAPANDITDATYIGDIKFGESLPAGTNAIGKLAANTGVDIGDVDILSIAAGDNNIGNVDIVTVPAPLSVVGGGTEAAALRVTLANDSTGVITVDGTVTANLSATDNAVLDTIDAVLDTINAKLVTGTVIGDVNLGATDNAVLDVIAGDTTSLDTKVTACNTGAVVLSSGTVTTVSTVTTLSQLGGQAISMGEGVLAAGCQRVTLATDDDGVAHLATIAGDTTNIETAIQVVDDWDATHASAAPADGAQVMGAAYSTALPTDVGADADAARLVTDRYGRLCTGLQPQAGKAVLNNADTTTAREVVAATASRKIYVTSLILSVDTAGNYWLEDGDATAVTGKFYLAANGGVAQTFPEGTPLSTATVNKALNVKGSTAGNVSVTITYYLAV